MKNTNNKDYRPKVGFCQNCGSPMNARDSLVIEYWVADQTVYFCWCHNCGWKGEVTDVVSFRTTEISED